MTEEPLRANAQIAELILKFASSSQNSSFTMDQKHPFLLVPMKVDKVSKELYEIMTKPRKLIANTKKSFTQAFVDTGQRPQNFIKGTDPTERFSEFPKLTDLIKKKDEVLRKRNTPARYIKADLKYFDLPSLGRFDVILIDPPWEEYSKRITNLNLKSVGNYKDISYWTYNELANLQVDAISNNPSFLFLWVGCSEGLELGRLLMKKWGFRRCEDVVWIKTNKSSASLGFSSSFNEDPNSILKHSKEHCLLGIKGTVKRGQDNHFIHANIDTDVILSEEPPLGNTRKPEELYHIIERFCLGRKRIELFGEDHNIRPGWLTVGKNITDSCFDQAEYEGWFKGDSSYPILQGYEGGKYVGTTAEIEQIRPKSPNRPPVGILPLQILNNPITGKLIKTKIQQPPIQQPL